MSDGAARRLRAVASSAALGCALLFSPAPSEAQDFFSQLFGWGGNQPRQAAPQRHATPRRASEAPGRKSRAQHQAHAGPAKNPAKTPAKPEAPPAPEQSASADTPPAPYDGQMQRLSEILGVLSYLRDLCGDGDGDYWRGKAAQLREADAPHGARRTKLTAAFNRGFRGYELTYHACTPNARQVIARYLAEAESVSREVAARYGNP